MFLAKPGEYEACGIFTIKHLILMVVTFVVIILTLRYTIKNKKDVSKIIKKCTIFVWILEFIKIVFNISTGGISHVNNWVPLYYCSLILYAGGFSSFAKGKLKRVGDVFLATGGIVGGIIFILFPYTSLPTYPMLHLISIHSFVYHGIMLYLGILINVTNYIELNKKDIVYYASLLGIICIIAYIVNNIFNSNLMFISQDFPGMPLEILFKMLGKFYTIFTILAQSILPFYTIYGLRKLIMENKPKKQNC